MVVFIIIIHDYSILYNVYLPVLTASHYFFMSPQKRVESLGKGRRIMTIKLGHPSSGAPTLLSYLLFKGVEWLIP